MRPSARSILLLVSFVLAASAEAQVPVMKRGPELNRLAFFEGEWKGRMQRFLPGGKTLQLTPSVRFDWAVGDAWLRGHDTTRLDGTTIENLVWLTWRARDQVYAGAWQDNVYPGFVTFEGRWLDEQRLELDTGTFDLGGRPHRVVFVYRKVSDDEFCTEMRQAWDAGEPAKVAEGCFRRPSSS